MPTTDANTPPRSMSATSIHGARIRGHQPEVHEVELAQVQLADAAGAFDDDDVEAAREILVRGEHVRPQLVGVLRSTRARTASSTRAR